MLSLLYYFLPLAGAFVGAVWWIETNTKQIMAKISSLAATVSALAEQQEKVVTEIKALKDSLSDVEIPAEAQAALDRLSAAIKSADDENPDSTPTPEA